MRQDFDQILLRPTKKQKLPERFLYFDTETVSERVGTEDHCRMDIAWTCYNVYDQDGAILTEKWCYFNDPEQLCLYINSLTKVKSPLILLAHNIFFDLQVSKFYHYFAKYGYILDFYYDQGLTYILTIRHNKKTIKALSSTNWYDFSLKYLGQMLNVPKLDINFGSSSRDELSIYCKQDTLIVKKATEHYLDFIRENKLHKFAVTKASQAFNAFRQRFMTTPIYLHNHQPTRDLERAGYFGGRTEAFQLGKIDNGPFLSLDINSMYPKIMYDTDVPIKLVEYRDKYSLDKLDYILNGFCAMAEVTLKTNKPIYAVRHKDKIVFPVGHFKTILCTRALRLALDSKHIQKIHRIAIYRKANLFRSYIDHFYALKEHYTIEHNLVMRELTKKLLNALYGKFAAKQPIITEEQEITYDGYYREEIYCLVTGKRGIRYKMFNKVIEEFGHEDSDLAFTAISAHITEDSRLLLWKLIDMIGYDRALYTDTDSIKIRKRDLHRVKYPIHPTELGALDIEDESEELTILGAKNYYTENKHVLKGVPKSAEEIAPGVYKYKSFLGQTTHLRKEVDDYFIIRAVVKKTGGEYTKANILENKRCKPFIFSRDESTLLTVPGVLHQLFRHQPI